MNIAKIVTRAVAIAAKLTSSAMVDISHEAYLGRAKNGVPTYDDPVTRPGIVHQRTRTVRSAATGRDTVATGPLIFVGEVAVNTQDRLTLPSGEVALVAFVERLLSPIATTVGGGYVTEVWLGEFGSRSTQ